MPPPPRPRRPARSTPVMPVTARRPDPAVWRAALALAEGDVKRLEVADDGTVTVRNAPRDAQRGR